MRRFYTVGFPYPAVSVRAPFPLISLRIPQSWSEQRERSLNFEPAKRAVFKLLSMPWFTSGASCPPCPAEALAKVEGRFMRPSSVLHRPSGRLHRAQRIAFRAQRSCCLSLAAWGFQCPPSWRLPQEAQAEFLYLRQFTFAVFLTNEKTGV